MEGSTQDDDFRNVLSKESKAIQSAINTHGSTALLEDKSLDLIAAIVYNRIAGITGGSNGNARKSGGITIGGFIQFLLTTVSLIYMTIMICKWLGVDIDLSNPFNFASKDESVVVGSFEFKKGSQISTSSFFGKKELFDLWEDRMLDSIKKIADKPKSTLDRLAVYQKLNFVLFGPPGTGKTLFVQTLATRIDSKLKELHLKETDPNYDKMKSESRGEYMEYVNKSPSRIYFCEVQPGMINSKYMGDSERNVISLFSSAKGLLKQKWTAVILFFDEGDVFFSNRISGTTPSGISTGNVKSELLTRIGVRPTEKYLPLFVFTATNRMDEFDNAFKRRFANQEEFGFPNTEERKQFIKFLLDGFSITEDEMALIVNYTEMKSYSYIAEKMKLFMTADDNGEFNQINFRKYIEFLKRNHHNRNMV